MIEPRKPRPIPARIPRRELVRLVQAVEIFLVELDAAMRIPATYERGRKIADLATVLEISKDAAKRAGLGEAK